MNGSGTLLRPLTILVRKKYNHDDNVDSILLGNGYKILGIYLHLTSMLLRRSGNTASNFNVQKSSNIVWYTVS